MKKFVMYLILILICTFNNTYASTDRFNLKSEYLISNDTVLVYGTVNLSVVNPKEGETYAYYITDVTTSESAKLRDFSSNSTFVWKASKVGVKELTLVVKSADNSTKEYKKTVTVTNKVGGTIFNSITTREQVLQANRNNMIIANAVSDDKNLSYKFLVKDPLGFTKMIRDWDDLNTALFYPKQEGIYNCIVYIKDSQGTIAKKTQELKVEQTYKFGLNVSLDKDNVHLSFDTDDPDKYEYKYICRDMETKKWYAISAPITGAEYIASPSLDFKLTDLKDISFKGLYNFYIDVREKGKETTNRYSYPVFFNYSSDKVIINNFPLKEVTEVKYGDTLDLSADITGNDVTYKYYYVNLDKPSSVTEVVIPDDCKFKVAFTDSNILYIIAQDKDGNRSAESSIVNIISESDFNIGALQTFNINDSTTDILAQSTTYNSLYKFIGYKTTTSDGIVLQDFNYNNLITCNTGDFYKVVVEVKDNTTGLTDYKVINLQNPTDDTNTEAPIIKSFRYELVDNTIKLEADAEGFGQLQYSFYYLDSNGSRILIKDFTASSTKNWTPGINGTLNVYVDVKDSVGLISTERISVDITNNVESNETSNELPATGYFASNVGNLVMLCIILIYCFIIYKKRN